ncbi:MAG: methionyl-tRNA formyltransferase [bacterium]|nr:methionyl-tRNA formyltransferase [bacterium]
MKKLRVIFMGTPEFAVASLQKLVENGVDVLAVITAPDKPKGRGKKLGTSPVKDYAVEKGLTILQPTNLKDPGFQEELAELKADLQVVVAFRMLPEAVWNMPPLGTFNLHASLLPQYRGAAPINWAIINGESETGVTTFFLKHEIDTGAIIFQHKEPIREDDNVGTLYQRLMNIGADLVLKTVEAVTNDDYPQIPQEETSDLKPAPKIFKEDCKIDWNQTTNSVHNFIRGLSPYPGAWTTLNGKILKVYKTQVSSNAFEGTPGDMRSNGKNNLEVKTSDGAIEVLELQLEGKKRMTIQEFLLGNKIDA